MSFTTSPPNDYSAFKIADLNLTFDALGAGVNAGSEKTCQNEAPKADEALCPGAEPVATADFDRSGWTISDFDFMHEALVNLEVAATGMINRPRAMADRNLTPAAAALSDEIDRIFHLQNAIIAEADAMVLVEPADRAVRDRMHMRHAVNYS